MFNFTRLIKVKRFTNIHQTKQRFSVVINRGTNFPELIALKNNYLIFHGRQFSERLQAMKNGIAFPVVYHHQGLDFHYRFPRGYNADMLAVRV